MSNDKKPPFDGTLPTDIPRRLAREVAFQCLFGMLSGTASTKVEIRQSDYEVFVKSFDSPIDEFSWELVSGTGQNIPAIDAALEKEASWKLDRMSKVDLTLLRLAAYEILFRPDIPKVVSINESIELSKRFGTEDSPAFINGVLDKLQK